MLMDVSIPEVSLPTTECPEPALWRCFDEQSAEVEVLDFLYQLVRTLKPKLTVETGSHRGISALYIGKALRDNGRGKLLTCEVDSQMYDISSALIAKERLQGQVDCRLTSSLDLEVSDTIDLLFLDSLPKIRMSELDRFWPLLSPSSLIAIHDVNTGWHGGLRSSVLRRDQERSLSAVLLPTPRGLALCQKRS
jgi:predicted O-methyltransferase YrrM